MTDNKKRDWSLKEFKEYLDLHHRNYAEDSLWPDKQKQCPPEFERFVELDQFFKPLDNIKILIEKLEEAESEIERTKIEMSGVAGATIGTVTRDFKETHVPLSEVKALIDSISIDCDCSIEERISGHKIDCNKYELKEALDQFNAKYGDKGV